MLKDSNNKIDQRGMKKVRLAAILITGLLFSLATPKTSEAQKIGAGLNYGSKLNMVGGQVSSTYRFHRSFRIAGDVSVFFPKDFEDSNDQWNWWSININGNFVFLETGQFRSYLLTGLNYATIQIQSPQEGKNDIDSALGLNAGAGVEYSLDFGDLYGETKYVFIDERYQQTAVNVGVRFYIGSSF